MTGPTPETYWVEEGVLLAGKYPGSKLDAEAREKVTALLALGVKTFVDLTESAEVLPYRHLLPDDVRHERIEIVDQTAPSREQIRRALDAIDAGRARGLVYVHCRGGCGRTGVVLGAYFVRHGAAPSDALARVHEVTRVLWNRPCPENRAQMDAVTLWSE